MKPRIADRMQGISPFYVMKLLQRAQQLERQGRDIIHMEIGEPDFPTPECVLEAGKQFLELGEVKYTDASGLPELRQAISHYYEQNYSVKIPQERIVITPGASGAFLQALGVTLNPGDEMMMADPCYPCNQNFVRLFNGKTKTVDVDAGTRYQLNAALISQHWGEFSKGVLIASPSNPTGTVIDKNELCSAIDFTLASNGVFYSDEIYHGLVYDTDAFSALQHSDDVFVINSFSKYFGMTGWRIGWLVVPDAYIDAVERLAQNIFISTTAVSQYAALAAFSPENNLELERRRRVLAERRKFLYDGLLQLGFKIECMPQGAFYIYAHCGDFTDDSFHFAETLLEKTGVAVTPGKDFGRNQENLYIRFAYTASIDRIADALHRLEQFICRSCS